MITVLWPYADGPGRDRPPQRASRRAVATACRRLGLQMRPAPCRGRYGYRDALADAWQTAPGRLLVVEHDVVTNVSQIERMARFPEGLCAGTYRLPPATPTTRLQVRSLSRSMPMTRFISGDFTGCPPEL